MRFLLEMLSEAMNRLSHADHDMLATVWRTVWLALGAVGIAALIGLPLGAAIGEARPRIRRASFAFANAGLGLPAVVLGVFVALLLLPGSPLDFLRWRNTVRGVFLVQILFAVPIVVALTASAVADLPAGLLTQARAFGAGRLSIAALALREARIGVTIALIGALGSAFGEVAAVVIVGGNGRGQTNTLASTVLLDLSASDPAAALANLIVLLGIIGVLGAALTVVQQRGRRVGAAA